jgi:hypothetical protein
LNENTTVKYEMKMFTASVWKQSNTSQKQHTSFKQATLDRYKYKNRTDQSLHKEGSATVFGFN